MTDGNGWLLQTGVMKEIESEYVGAPSETSSKHFVCVRKKNVRIAEDRTQDFNSGSNRTVQRK